MSLDMLEAGFEWGRAQPDLAEPWPGALRADLIRQLAWQLALAHGEDPDEQPYPLRYPRWRFHCGRAKVLLSISEAEHQALAVVLDASIGRPRGRKPKANWPGFWSRFWRVGRSKAT